jgi:hypothetical protein
MAESPEFFVSESQEKLLPLLPPHSGAEGEAEAPHVATSRHPMAKWRNISGW